MGANVANDYIYAHCQPGGVSEVGVRYHYGSKGVDAYHVLTASEVADLRAYAGAANQTGFLAVLASAVPWWGQVPVGDRPCYYSAGLLLWG